MSHDKIDNMSKMDDSNEFTFDKYKILISQISDIQQKNTSRNELYVPTCKQQLLTSIPIQKKNNYKTNMMSGTLQRISLSLLNRSFAYKCWLDTVDDDVGNSRINSQSDNMSIILTRIMDNILERLLIQNLDQSTQITEIFYSFRVKRLIYSDKPFRNQIRKSKIADKNKGLCLIEGLLKAERLKKS